MRHEKEEDAQAPNLRHRVMAGFIGNVVEWYDFALYGASETRERLLARWDAEVRNAGDAVIEQ